MGPELVKLNWLLADKSRLLGIFIRQMLRHRGLVILDRMGFSDKEIG